MKFRNLASALAVMSFLHFAHAQESPKYDYVEAFKPFF